MFVHTKKQDLHTKNQEGELEHMPSLHVDITIADPILSTKKVIHTVLRGLR